MCDHQEVDIALDNEHEPWKVVVHCMFCDEDLSKVSREAVLANMQNPERKWVKFVYEQRPLEEPTLDEAFRWVVSEIGEIAEALNMRNPKWNRNNPKKTGVVKTNGDILTEVGDARFMLSVLSLLLEGDPDAAFTWKQLDKIAEAHNAAHKD